MLDDDDDEELKAQLTLSVEILATALLGKPNKSASSSREMRWGKKGGISLSLQGPRRGSWFNHEAGYGGGPLQIIMHAQFLGYAEAKAWAREWLSLPGKNWQGHYAGAHPAAALLAKLTRPDAEDSEADDAKRLRNARLRWETSVPLAGTLGERYLTEHRGIPHPAGGWPDAVRYHPSRELVVAATNDDGDVMAVQRVLLNADGAKISAEEAARLRPSTAKVTNGLPEGAAVRLPALAPGLPLLLAEGPETGLSLWTATGCETWISLGSVGKLAPVAGRRILAARDDDRRYSPADLATARAIRGWRRGGIDVAPVFPWPFRRYDKSDFNDLMQKGGAEAVRSVIDTALKPPAAKSRPSERLEHVRDSLAIATCALYAVATEVPPAHWVEPVAIGARVDVGVGKSAIARAGAVAMLTLLRSRGDNRNVAVAVPTHKLGDEQALAFNALKQAQAAGLEAAVWRGMEAEDPASPGETMCRRLPAVRDAIKAGVSVQTAACKRSVPGFPDIKCPLFDHCAYQRQRALRPDLWLVAHEMIFFEKPDALGDLAAVVVDESFWQAGLAGTGPERITLALDALDGDATVPDAPGATGRLTFLRRRVLDVLRDLPNGPVTRAALLEKGLTSGSAEEARGLEWRRRVDVPMAPGMPEASRRQAVLAGAENLTINRLDMMWRAIGALLAEDGPEASGWARIDDVLSDHGTVRALVLKSRRPVRKGWRVPTMLIDANFNPDLARPFFPFLLPLVDLAAEAPHMNLRQVIDQAYSKRHFGMTGTKDDAEARRGEKNLRDAAAILDREARRSAGGGTALVITNKAIKDALPRAWMIPPSVETAHFNAIAGLDGWGGVRSLVTLGSTNPPPAAVEELAEALTGEHVAPLARWYERHTVTRETTDGPVLSEAERHPHPIAEAIRWHIREGEVIQAIGRARGVNRTAENSVDVLVMGDAVLPFEVEAVEAAGMQPSPIDRMLAAGGVAPEGPAHAAKAYPQLWPSAEAAKKAFQRDTDERSGTSPDKENSIRGCPAPRLTKLTYQLQGAGQKPATALADIARVPDPRAWLTERLGPLASLTVEDIAA